jgi:hypothetical protein
MGMTHHIGKVRPHTLAARPRAQTVEDRANEGFPTRAVGSNVDGMLSEDEKTPSLIIVHASTIGADRVDAGVVKTAALTPAPRKTPPAGRPPGALSISEMVEKITEEVTRGAADELDRKHRELRAELGAEIRSAASLSIAALVMNAVVILAVLGVAHALPGRGVGVALIALTAVFVGAITVGSRRGRTTTK